MLFLGVLCCSSLGNPPLSPYPFKGMSSLWYEESRETEWPFLKKKKKLFLESTQSNSYSGEIIGASYMLRLFWIEFRPLKVHW
jgi:hypothetical protein